MKSSKICLYIVISLISFFLNMACVPTSSTTSYKPVNPVTYLRTFSKSYDNVWSATISAISDLDWETEFINKDGGIIKFRKSYLFSHFATPEESHRIYEDTPDVNYIKYGNSKPWLRKYTSYDESLKGNIKTTVQNMVIKVKKKDKNTTTVNIKFSIEGTAFWSGKFYPDSNGMYENEIFSAIEKNM